MGGSRRRARSSGRATLRECPAGGLRTCVRPADAVDVRSLGPVTGPAHHGSGRSWAVENATCLLLNAQGQGRNPSAPERTPFRLLLLSIIHPRTLGAWTPAACGPAHLCLGSGAPCIVSRSFLFPRLSVPLPDLPSLTGALPRSQPGLR